MLIPLNARKDCAAKALLLGHSPHLPQASLAFLALIVAVKQLLRRRQPLRRVAPKALNQEIG
jgi:hypothetical protein